MESPDFLLQLVFLGEIFDIGLHRVQLPLEIGLRQDAVVVHLFRLDQLGLHPLECIVVSLQLLLPRGLDGLVHQLLGVHFAKLVHLVLRKKLTQVSRLDVEALDEVLHFLSAHTLAVQEPVRFAVESNS